MKLWHLSNMKVTWGEMMHIIVRAKDESAARKLASKNAYGEGKDAWFDSEKTICHELSIDGKEKVILRANAD